jgi:hypothetical protein
MRFGMCIMPPEDLRIVVSMPLVHPRVSSAQQSTWSVNLSDFFACSPNNTQSQAAT